MSSVIKSDLHFRIGHVLFIDIVAYSDLLITEQHDFVEQLNELVRSADCFRRAEASGELLCLPAGDGMALVFSGTVESALECALEIGRELSSHPGLHVRMGIHSGPISLVTDVNDRSNVAGAGINMAQRVMSRGDAGHILLSRHVAEDLEQYPRWRSCLHDLGECEIKHGHKLGIVNCYTAEAGNPKRPISMEFPEPGSRRGLRNRLAAILGTGMVAAAVAAVFIYRASEFPRLEKSIAVLPFENLSNDKENAYFADGIQDDVLTNLAKIGDLKVISRTSVMQYRGRPQSARQIGKALGVATVLEGSVRRDGKRVRVNVQLVDTKTDEHIWAEDYDRELTDVFAIQSDLALRIASALQSRLSATEKARLERPPTKNGEAYLTYLQGRDQLQHGRLEDGADLLQKATKLDPTFALAFANWSYALDSLYHARGAPALLDDAGAAVNEALRLQPHLPEAHFALAYHYYRGNREYARALRELAIARDGLPNDADIFLVMGSIKRRQGKWQESIADLKKAATLNPNDPSLWANLGTSYQAIHDFGRAARAFDRGITSDSTFFMNHWLRANLELERTGNLGPCEQVLAEAASLRDIEGQLTLARFQFSLLQRKYVKAQEILKSSDLESFVPWRPPIPLPRALLLGFAYRLAGASEQAQARYEEARQILEAAIQENPTDASRHALLGQAYAGLGRAEDALREGRRAVELMPEAKDAWDGPGMTLSLASIQTMLGNTGEAVALLQHLLSIPGGISIPSLQLDPAWDSLRADWRFQALLATPSSQNQN